MKSYDEGYPLRLICSLCSMSRPGALMHAVYEANQSGRMPRSFSGITNSCYKKEATGSSSASFPGAFCIS